MTSRTYQRYEVDGYKNSSFLVSEVVTNDTETSRMSLLATDNALSHLLSDGDICHEVYSTRLAH